ncbi:hypothetical protein chiPu_0027797, partial [Chiloscyllium punctatum]|nr:hypothetical protein [Chiloscyllium punctatum]
MGQITGGAEDDEGARIGFLLHVTFRGNRLEPPFRLHRNVDSRFRFDALSSREPVSIPHQVRDRPRSKTPLSLLRRLLVAAKTCAHRREDLLRE